MSAAAQPDARAVRLLREVVGCEPDNLPPYNEEEVRLVIEECHEHWGLMQQIFEGLKDRQRKEARRRARRKRRAARAAAEAAAAAVAAATEARPRSDAGGEDDDEENAPPPAGDGDEATAQKDAERRKAAATEAAAAAAAEEGGSDGGDGEDGDGGDGDDPFARDPAGAAAVLCHHAIIARNKRLLLTYLSERVERLKALRWRHAVLPARVRQGLSSSEAEFFGAYDRLLSRYSSASPPAPGASASGAAGLDLTQADRPPRPPGGVMVRCVAAAGLGDVAFSTGTFRLDPGSVHTLPPEEAEPLLREGALVEVTNGAREQQEMPAL